MIEYFINFLSQNHIKHQICYNHYQKIKKIFKFSQFNNTKPKLFFNKVHSNE
jgi:hypothetical protein